jgi:hypothetical protein
VKQFSLAHECAFLSPNFSSPSSASLRFSGTPLVQIHSNPSETQTHVGAIVSSGNVLRTHDIGALDPLDANASSITWRAKCPLAIRVLHPLTQHINVKSARQQTTHC